MNAVAARPATRYGVLSVALVLAIFAAFGYKVIRNRSDRLASENFVLRYPPATDGWQSCPHGPLTLFQYEQPKTGLMLTGAVNQMIDDINPTPDLDRDNLAQQIIDNTKENMPGWTAEMKEEVDAKGTTFRVVRRALRTKVVLTAFAVKGNTTVLISLSAKEKDAGQVDRATDQFKGFVSSLQLTQADLSRL